MALSRPDEVLAALADGKPSSLIGTRESAQIDFKEHPYQLGTAKGKWELAKDVAGLANLNEGVLVIGVRTEKTEGKFREVAKELRPVSAADLNYEQYYSVIRDLVRPAVDFNIEFFADPDNSGKGYMAVHVKPLAESERYAIVRRMLDHEDKLVNAFGVPVRDIDQTRWLSADETYRLLRDGQRANAPASAQVQVTEITEPLNLDEAVDRLVELKDWDDPLLIWQSMPQKPVDLLSQMWGRDGISQKLFNPSSLRSTGFNWYFLTEVKSFDGGALASDGRHAIWVNPNGMITAAAPVADDGILTWAMSSSPGRQLNIVAVTELTLEYFRLVDNAILPGTEVRYTHAIATRKFTSDPPVLLPAGLPGTMGSFSARPVSSEIRSAFSQAIPADAERDAYEALWRLYANFQLGPEAVPFAANGRIDTEKLLEWVRIAK